MLFCPFCGALLLLEHAGDGGLMYSCKSLTSCGSPCQYISRIRTVNTETVSLQQYNKRLPDAAERKDPAAAAKADAETSTKPKTTILCASPGGTCDSNQATYEQVQLRSADEPPTTFYQCLKCQYRWRID